MSVQYFEGIGRRKEATARVRVMSGTGKFIVNEKPVEEYFPRLGDIEAFVDSFQADRAGPHHLRRDRDGQRRRRHRSDRFGTAGSGPRSGQDERRMVPLLRKGGLLTRDPRIKERKKPGLKRARKAPTYTKR